MQLGPPETAPPPSGMHRLAMLVGVVLVLLVLLVLPDFWGGSRNTEPSFLAELPSADAGLAEIRGEVGLPPQGDGGLGLDGPLDLDAPMDLDAPVDLRPSGPSRPDRVATRGAADPSTTPTHSPRGGRGELDIPVPTPAPSPGEVGSGGDGGGIPPRPVDYERLFAAHAAGDLDYLVGILQDPSYEETGRMLASTLLATFRGPVPSSALTEVFEDGREVFSLREASVYGLLQVEGPSFGSYLARVAERPSVAGGQDEARARLVVLGFYADQQVGTGEALGEAGPHLMRLARAGNGTALAALSFALRAGEPREGEMPLLEKRSELPVVSENLLRYYRRLVDAGQEEYREKLERLEARRTREL